VALITLAVANGTQRLYGGKLVGRRGNGSGEPGSGRGKSTHYSFQRGREL